MNTQMCELDINSSRNIEYHSELELGDINSECFVEFMRNLSQTDQSSPGLSTYETTTNLPATSDIIPIVTNDTPQNADVISPTCTNDKSIVGSLLQRYIEVEQQQLFSGVEHGHGTSFIPLHFEEEPFEYLSSFMEVDDVLTIEDVTLSTISTGSTFSDMTVASHRTSHSAIGVPSSIAAMNSPVGTTSTPEVQKTKPVGKFPCNECDLVFRQSGNLRKHVDEIHRKRKPFACPECPSKFSRKHARDTHLRAVHHKLRPFQCSDCFKRYKNRSDLNKHVRTVERKEKPYTCKICNKGFGERGKLKRHMPVHDR